MPNRILRDWTDSETIDALTVHAERFFTRLIMKVDDYGRYNANVKFLKSTLFPLRTDVRETDITRWLTECKASGLILTYNIASKDYLQIENFKQQLRQKNEKYPAPQPLNECAADAQQTHSTCEHETKRNESEVETEEEAAISPTHTREQIVLYERFEAWVKENAPRVNELKQPITIDEFFKLKEKVGFDVLKTLLTSMHNYKPLLSKSVSAYLTVLNWSKRENNTNGNAGTEPKARFVLPANMYDK